MQKCSPKNSPPISLDSFIHLRRNVASRSFARADGSRIASAPDAFANVDGSDRVNAVTSEAATLGGEAAAPGGGEGDGGVGRSVTPLPVRVADPASDAEEKRGHLKGLGSLEIPDWARELDAAPTPTDVPTAPPSIKPSTEPSNAPTFLPKRFPTKAPRKAPTCRKGMKSMKGCMMMM